MGSDHSKSIGRKGQLLELPLGAVLRDRYVVESLLGQGMSARVYRCRDTMLGNLLIALKVYPPDIISDKVSAGRVNRELLSSYGIDHPNVARFYECIRTEGFIGMVMEYVPGQNLEHLLVSGNEFSLLEVTHILHQIILGLAAIHSAGVLHRDLKPGNIMISANGAVKITDFGLAKKDGFAGGTEVEPETTGGGDAVGTPMYVAPEYLEHGVCDFRSDIYALGIIAYELATGEEPFPFVNMYQFVEAKIHSRPLPPHQINPQCPAELSLIIMKMMAADPNDRFQTVRELDECFIAFRRRLRVSEASATKMSRSFEELTDDERSTLMQDDESLGSGTRGRKLHQPETTNYEPDILQSLLDVWTDIPAFLVQNGAVVVVTIILFGIIVALIIAISKGNGRAEVESAKEVLGQVVTWGQ